MNGRTGGQSTFKMRGLIFFGLAGYLLAIQALPALNLNDDKVGIDIPMEGCNRTANGTCEKEFLENPEKDPKDDVKWNGTWIGIENTLGFPPRPADGKGKIREERAAKPDSTFDTGEWNGLEGTGGFGNLTQGFNMTINSTATNSSLAPETNN